MDSLTIKLKTSTPIWTGGIKRDCDRIHETGFIGSLRWWYEALIRASGNNACNIVSSECKDEKRCKACELFGCTGWSRKFRLSIEGNFKTEIRTDNSPYQCKDRNHGHRGWYIPKGLTADCFNIKIIPLKEIKQEEMALMKTTFKIIIEKAGLAAKNQLGYGIIDYYDETEKNKLNDYFVPEFKVSNGNAYPNVKEIFFSKVIVQSDDIEELIDLKCKLRKEFRSLDSVTHLQNYQLKILRHFILGTAQKDKKIASKIFLSRPLSLDNNGQKFIRIWGWIPMDIPFNVQRSGLITKIKKIINPIEFQDLYQNTNQNIFKMES